MQFFVLNKDVITGVIHTNMEMHLKSARYIPTTKESLATYQKWLAGNPSQQPTIADIFSSTSINSNVSPVKAPAAKPNTRVSKPLSKPAADKKAVIKQFQQFIRNR